MVTGLVSGVFCTLFGGQITKSSAPPGSRGGAKLGAKVRSQVDAQLHVVEELKLSALILRG